ncbi:carbohydrate sulfotransferase 4-like [Bicyclus anynana]|uniref:Carbohydrate sulfotransferase 4-like n=1 Tax=Bicyclus anynana TaxID=110368 RepID=A0A6J1P382_BICAN|nr:carbohydrate sulfotransferase 4-like [Bicyclus anynana]
MLRRSNFCSICIAFNLSVLLTLAGSQNTDNTNHLPSGSRSRDPKNIKPIEDVDDSLLQLPTNPDGTPNIDKILDRTRLKIKNELSNYNFAQSRDQNLDGLLMESGGQPFRSLITSTWRSGTTFLGEVLNALPGNFYHFEPLINFGIVQIKNTSEVDKALETITKMFHCNFDAMEDYFEYGRNHSYQFSPNRRLWDHCKYKKELCIDADFTSRFCKLFPFQTMKVVRVRLHHIRQLLEDTELNLKVIFLIRDPRGVMQSRQHCGFCLRTPDCLKPELLCADMISDYVAATSLKQEYPHRFMIVRFEEMALNPNSTTQAVLKFLGLDRTPSIDEFLQSHTNFSKGGISSTFRVSRDVPFKWKNVLDFNYVNEIQMKCKEAMSLWGYRNAHNATHMTSKDYNPLDQNHCVDQFLIPPDN